MAIQITDDLSCIKVNNDGEILFIQKKLVKTIDTLRNDTVRIDIGEGPLKHVFININDVTLPAGLEDVAELRDAIKVMLDAGEDGVSDPTLENQEEELGLLTTIKDRQITDSGLLTNIKDGQTTANGHLSNIKNAQDAHTSLLEDMIDLLTQLNSTMSEASAPSFGDPSRIDESEPGIVYYGYGASGADPMALVWAIKRVRRVGDEYITEWADGDQQYNNKWADHHVLVYLPLDPTG
ncbi:MAG TPA: hypothetical protein VEB40_02110 [Flavipsychrobacter sp.]|nr:hypothetical protein [Flavipsychrobacter sp.]